MNRRLIITENTDRLIHEQAEPVYGFRSTTIRLDDGRLALPVDDEVFAAIDHARLPGETDDDVVVRLVLAAIGRKPS
jgi:hypothetical protein